MLTRFVFPQVHQECRLRAFFSTVGFIKSKVLGTLKTHTSTRTDLFACERKPGTRGSCTDHPAALTFLRNICSTKRLQPTKVARPPRHRACAARRQRAPAQCVCVWGGRGAREVTRRVRRESSGGGEGGRRWPARGGRRAGAAGETGRAEGAAPWGWLLP